MGPVSKGDGVCCPDIIGPRSPTQESTLEGPAGSTPLVSCRLTDGHDRLSTKRSTGNGPEVCCGSRGLASASQRGPFCHSTESQSHNGLISLGVCGLTPKFSAAAVPFFSIRLSDCCGATQKTRRRDDGLHKTQPLWLIRRYTSTAITRLITGNIKMSVQGSLAVPSNAEGEELINVPPQRRFSRA